MSEQNPTHTSFYRGYGETGFFIRLECVATQTHWPPEDIHVSVKRP